LTIDEMVDLIAEESENRPSIWPVYVRKKTSSPLCGKSCATADGTAINLVTTLWRRGSSDSSKAPSKAGGPGGVDAIVAGIGDNSGNRPSTMIVRAMALDQVNFSNTSRTQRTGRCPGQRHRLRWGSGGIGAYLLYDSWSLGMVLTAAMTLNLLRPLMGVL
jgi:magnesium transporter